MDNKEINKNLQKYYKLHPLAVVPVYLELPSKDNNNQKKIYSSCENIDNPDKILLHGMHVFTQNGDPIFTLKTSLN